MGSSHTVHRDAGTSIISEDAPFTGCPYQVFHPDLGS